jgi:hypothetical protein
MIVDNDVFLGLGVRINLIDQKDFLKIRETLTRIGISSAKEKKLFQSCHILHKRGEYAILHFKELFKLDGKQATLTDDDIARRNTIVKILEEWNLLVIRDKNRVEKTIPVGNLKILSFKEKNEWQLEAKYNIGSKKKK